MRLSGLSYGGRSLANPMDTIREMNRRKVADILEAMNGLFPPCHGDRLRDWVETHRKLGTISNDEAILIMAYRHDFGGHYGLREF